MLKISSPAAPTVGIRRVRGYVRLCHGKQSKPTIVQRCPRKVRVRPAWFSACCFQSWL
jgi:hypothetical protein